MNLKKRLDTLEGKLLQPGAGKVLELFCRACSGDRDARLALAHLRASGSGHPRLLELGEALNLMGTD